MSKYVYSTLSCNQKYTIWDESNKSDIHVAKEHIIIRGGTNIADKHLHTPEGVLTVITDDQAKKLQTIHAFLEHQKLGFVKIENKKKEPEVGVIGMEKADNSAPKTPAYFKKAKDLAVDGRKVKPVDELRAV